MQSSIPKEGALDIDPDFNAMFLQTIIMRNSQVLNYSLVHIWTPSSTFSLVSTPLSSCSSDSDSTVQDIIPPSQQRSQAQRPIRCDNTSTHPCRSQEASPPVSIRARTLSPEAHKCERYHPYTRRGGTTPLGLRFTARSLGFSSHTAGMTIEDVAQVRRAMVSLDIQLTLLRQGKVHFINGLSHMPDRALLKAHKLKRADRDCVLHRVSLASAEII